MSDRKVYVACDPADALETSRLLKQVKGSAYYGNSQPFDEVMPAGTARDPNDLRAETAILRRIRLWTLRDSTVTVVVIGQCTHSVKTVDWEIKASLFGEGSQAPNGLVAVCLPGSCSYESLPARLQANLDDGKSAYARFWQWPTEVAQWDQVIEDAFVSRVSRAAAIRNDAPLMEANLVCRNCGVIHER